MSVSGSGQEQKRRAMVSVRLAPDEEAVLKAEAAERGQTLSQYLRDVLLQQAEAATGVVDLRQFASTTTAVAGGLSFEAEDGQLVPRMAHGYITPITAE